MPSFKDMMPDLVSARIDVEFYGVTSKLPVTYHPRRIGTDPKGNVKIVGDGGDDDEAFSVGDTGDSQARALCYVLATWEATGPVPMDDLPDGTKEGSVVADGKPIPLEPEVLALLPTMLLQGIITGVTNHALPDPTKRAIALLKRK